MAAVGQEYVSASRARGEGWEQGGKGSPRSFSVARRVFKIIMIISFSEAHEATKFDTRTFVRDRSEVFGYEGKV